MRYVPSLPPLPSPVEGEEPGPVRAVRPVRPVEPRTRVPRVIQRFIPKARTEEGEEGASGPTVVRLEKRATSDRREWCRRLQRGQPFLNTRSTVERRKKKRRDSDVATTLDEEG